MCLKEVSPTHPNVFHCYTTINHDRVFSGARHYVKRHTSIASLSTTPVFPSGDQSEALWTQQGTEGDVASEWPSWNLNPGSLTLWLRCLSNALSRRLDLVSNLVFKVSVHSPRNQNQITGPPVGVRGVMHSGLSVAHTSPPVHSRSTTALSLPLTALWALPSIRYVLPGR